MAEFNNVKGAGTVGWDWLTKQSGHQKYMGVFEYLTEGVYCKMTGQSQIHRCVLHSVIITIMFGSCQDRVRAFFMTYCSTRHRVSRCPVILDMSTM